jgi:hypothetical protein
MIYTGQILNIDNKRCKQVTKKAARNIFYSGKTIWLHSCNLTINNPWQTPMPGEFDPQSEISKMQLSIREKECGFEFDFIDGFEDWCNSFAYYNHDNERGKRTLFFTEV